jgi:hypothetical protein
MTGGRFSSYDRSYIFYNATNGWQTTSELLSIENNPEEGSLQRASKGDIAAECYSPNIEANHPEPPWFHWHAGSGHSEYQVQH